MGELSDDLLRCLVHIVGRASMPTETVCELVGNGKKQIQAFNLCDGTLSQSEISKKTKVDQGNLSRTFDRWVKHGIAFWIGEGTDAKLMHIYPVPPGGSSRRRFKK
jgi:hypothetical protein